MNTTPTQAFSINKGAFLERKKATIIIDKTMETTPI